MDDLTEQSPAFALYRFGNPAKSWDAVTFVAVHPLLTTKAGPVDTDAFEDDQPGATGGPRLVVRKVAFGRQVVFAVIGGVSGDEDAIANFGRTDADGFKDVGICRVILHTNPFSIHR